MNKSFAEEIRKGVASVLEDKEVLVQEVKKTNRVKKPAIVIRTEGANVAPTIYIDENRDVKENVQMILASYRMSKVQNIDASWYSDYENVKTKLGVLLTSRPLTGLAKRKAPGFDDLYMHAYCLIEDCEFGRGNIKVTTAHLKTWGISNATLFKDALESAPNIAPVKRYSMADKIPFVPADIGIEILTSESEVLGASAILYTDVEEGTYMIPSSIHEVILVKEGTVDVTSLNAIIGMVNSECVAPEEVLGTHAYRYNGKVWENV